MRRLDAFAVDPCRTISRRAAGADHLSRRRARRASFKIDRLRRRRDHADPRKDAGQRRDPQQRILDRARRHRRARRQVAVPRLRPQLEFGRTFGRNRQTRLGQWLSDHGIRTRPRFHGSCLHCDRRSAGIARDHSRKRRALVGDVPGVSVWRCWSMALTGRWPARLTSRSDAALVRRYLDLVVDFTTYVFVPAYAISVSGLLPGVLAIPPASCRRQWRALFRRPRNEDKDNYFRGFPVLWNLAAFYLYLLSSRLNGQRPWPWSFLPHSASRQSSFFIRCG